MFAEKEIDHTTPDTMYTCRGKVLNNGGWERTVALERRREGDIFNTGNTTNYFRSVLAPSIVQHTSSVGDVHITCQFPPKAAVKHCRRSIDTELNIVVGTVDPILHVISSTDTQLVFMKEGDSISIHMLSLEDIIDGNDYEITSYVLPNYNFMSVKLKAGFLREITHGGTKGKVVGAQCLFLHDDGVVQKSIHTYLSRAIATTYDLYETPSLRPEYLEHLVVPHSLDTIFLPLQFTRNQSMY